MGGRAGAGGPHPPGRLPALQPVRNADGRVRPMLRQRRDQMGRAQGGGPAARRHCQRAAAGIGGRLHRRRGCHAHRLGARRDRHRAGGAEGLLRRALCQALPRAVHAAGAAGLGDGPCRLADGRGDLSAVDRRRGDALSPDGGAGAAARAVAVAALQRLGAERARSLHCQKSRWGAINSSSISGKGPWTAIGLLAGGEHRRARGAPWSGSPLACAGERQRASPPRRHRSGCRYWPSRACRRTWRRARRWWRARRARESPCRMAAAARRASSVSAWRTTSRLPWRMRMRRPGRPARRRRDGARGRRPSRATAVGGAEMGDHLVAGHGGAPSAAVGFAPVIEYG